MFTQLWWLIKIIKVDSPWCIDMKASSFGNRNVTVHFYTEPMTLSLSTEMESMFLLLDLSRKDRFKMFKETWEW